jgi:hypothetical protein
MEGMLISSSARSSITVQEIHDAPLLPDYPYTSETGILYFIHEEIKPINSDSYSLKNETGIGTRIVNMMTKVSSNPPYAKHIPTL